MNSMRKKGRILGIIGEKFVKDKIFKHNRLRPNAYLTFISYLEVNLQSIRKHFHFIVSAECEPLK